MAKFQELSEDVQDCIRSNKPNYHYDSMSPDEMWESYLDWNGIIGYAIDLHDAHQEIYEDTTALNILDAVWDILMSVQPAGFNTPYATILAATGRKDELLKYLGEYLEKVKKDQSSAS